MMQRRHVLPAIASMGLAAHGVLAAQGKPVRMGYGLAEASNQGRAVRHFAQRVADLSAGRIRVETTGAAKLGNDAAMQKALVAGTQELMVGSTATLVEYVPEMAVWDAPFLFDNEQQVDKVLDGVTGERIKAKLEAKGLVGLVYWENGFRQLTNNVRAVASVADFAGLKLRVIDNDVFAKTFEALGATPVPLPFAELGAALKSGKVDGQENPLNTILSSKFYESQKYLTMSRHIYSPWIVTASKKWWDTLPEADRKAIMQAATQSRSFERSDTRQEAQQALAQLKSLGMEVNVPSRAQLQSMRRRMNAVYAVVSKGVGLEVWAEVVNAVLQAS